jgi:CrcB protein
MSNLLLIGTGGFMGALARYLVDSRVAGATGGGFPWGTLAVNLIGSFVIGILFVLLTERAALPPELRGPLMIGFIGSFTTFSTLTLESWRLIEDGVWLAAGANLFGSIALGMLAVVGGIVVGRLV